MAHFHYSYYKGRDLVTDYYSQNFSTFNHAYDSADFSARYFARVDNGTITRTNNTITVDWNKGGDNFRIIYEIFG